MSVAAAGATYANTGTAALSSLNFAAGAAVASGGGVLSLPAATSSVCAGGVTLSGGAFTIGLWVNLNNIPWSDHQTVVLIGPTGSCTDTVLTSATTYFALLVLGTNSGSGRRSGLHFPLDNGYWWFGTADYHSQSTWAFVTATLPAVASPAAPGAVMYRNGALHSTSPNNYDFGVITSSAVLYIGKVVGWGFQGATGCADRTPPLGFAVPLPLPPPALNSSLFGALLTTPISFPLVSPPHGATVGRTGRFTFSTASSPPPTSPRFTMDRRSSPSPA